MKTILILFFVSLSLHTTAQSTVDGPQAVSENPAYFKEIVFTVCEIPPSYPGGEKAFKKYVNDNAYFDGISCTAGKYIVMVRLIVATNGSASEITLENSPECDLGHEALRLVKKLLKWKPGMQNGYAVNAYLRIPVEFDVKD